MEVTQLNNYIKIYDDIFREDQINKFYKICETFDGWQSASVTGSEGNRIDKKIRDTQNWPLSNINSKSMTDVHWASVFAYTFSNNLQKYNSTLIPACAITTTVNDIQVLKYGDQGHYDFHVDHGPDTCRTMSCIFFVNDNYDGGSLVFKTPDGQKDLKIEKKKNRMVIWPSTFLFPHSVEPVTSGTRYSVVAWAL